MLLYNNSWSGNCYKVRLLFAQLGIEYDRREMDAFDRSDRREVLGDLNPALRVPTLVLDDGRALAESGAILFHFAEGTEYLPSDPFERAQVLQWLFFEQYNLEPNIAVVRFWTLAGIHPPEAELEAKRKAGQLALDALEGAPVAAGLPGRRSVHDRRHRPVRLHPRRARGRLRAGALPVPCASWLTRVAAQPGHIAITD